MPGVRARRLRRRRAPARRGSRPTPARVPGSGGTWAPAGRGPLIADDERFDEINGLGLGKLNGRISDFAYDRPGNRLFAAVGEGGVWQSDDLGAHAGARSATRCRRRRSAAIDYSPAGGGTLVVATGDNVFGGGGTFAGLGVFRTIDDGAHVAAGHRRARRRDRVQGRRRPHRPERRLRRHRRRPLPLDQRGRELHQRAPPHRPAPRGCTGASPDEARLLPGQHGHRRRRAAGPDNAATDSPSPGAVVAAVGWRAGNKVNPVRLRGVAQQRHLPLLDGRARQLQQARRRRASPRRTGVGRIELGHADGSRRTTTSSTRSSRTPSASAAAPSAIDVPEEDVGPLPNNTVLDGIYVSDDFGTTWTLMANAEELKDPDDRLRAHRHGVRDALLPGRPGLVQPPHLGRPDAPDGGRDPDQRGLRARGALAEPQHHAGRRAGSPTFRVVGPYFSGDSCLFLTIGIPFCPTTAGDPAEANKTTHPDHHASLWIPRGSQAAPVLVVGHDGGVNAQVRRRHRRGEPRRLGAAATTTASTRCCPTTPRSPRTASSTPASRTTAR